MLGDAEYFIRTQTVEYSQSLTSLWVHRKFAPHHQILHLVLRVDLMVLELQILTSCFLLGQRMIVSSAVKSSALVVLPCSNTVEWV